MTVMPSTGKFLKSKKYLQHNVQHFKEDIESFEGKRHDIRFTKQGSVTRVSNLSSKFQSVCLDILLDNTCNGNI
jgi:hypothetical protein